VGGTIYAATPHSIFHQEVLRHLGPAPVGRGGTGQARAVMIRGLLHPAVTGSSGACPAIVHPGTLWVQVAALLPTRQVHHLLGCHRPRIPDRVIFDKLIQVLVFGCGYRRIADERCSATTLRRRRDEWITAGVAEQLRLAVLAAYDRLFGWNWSTWPWTGAPPRRPAAARLPDPVPWTAASRG
jgi:transposase